MKNAGPDWHASRLGELVPVAASGVTRISRPPGSVLLDPFASGAPLPDAVLVDVAPF